MIEQCDICGGSMILLNNTNPFHSRCESCGHESYCLADVFPPAPSKEDVESVLVAIHWKSGRASNEEINALRRFVKGLLDRPISETYTQVLQNPKWVLGIYPRNEARCIIEKAAKSGLLAEIENLTDER